MKIKLPIRIKKSPEERQASTEAKKKLQAAVARASRRRPVVEDEDEDAYYEQSEPSMKLSHAFVVVLVLHVIAVAGVFAFNTIKVNRQASRTIVEATEQESPAVERTTADAAEAANAIAAAPSVAPVQNAMPRVVEPAASGISQAATDISASTQKTYQVRPGDTLTRIAALHGVSIDALQAANQIADPAGLKVNQVLTIPPGKITEKTNATTNATKDVNVDTKPAPAKTVAMANTPTAKSKTPTKESTGKTYTVVKGDNPVAIAKKLNVKYADLIRINQIDDPRKLQIGQKLKVPSVGQN